MTIRRTVAASFLALGSMIFSRHTAAEVVDVKEITVPPGNNIEMDASGTQYYPCVLNDHKQLVFSAVSKPDARMETAQGVKVHHYGTPEGPAWEASDGSKIIAKPVEKAQTPGSIPALKLEVIKHEGPEGIFTKVNTVYRTNTKLGTVPELFRSAAGACSDGDGYEAAYRATYTAVIGGQRAEARPQQ